MSPPSNAPPLPFYQTFLASAIGACTAETVSIPLDTAKVTLQLQPKHGVQKYRGLLGTTATLARERGIGALYNGLAPGLHRQIIYGGLRVGLYEHFKAGILSLTGGIFNSEGLGIKVVSALATGAFAITISSPTDLVKVRLQAQGRLPVEQRRYKGAMDAYRTIVREEGVAALWTGLGPNVVRNATINAAELASYDQIKQVLLSSGVVSDGVPCHLAAGFGAGFVATCVGSPVDVVKSRIMGAPPGTYNSMLDAFAKTIARDGPLALYSGFGPNFARIGTYNVVMFLVFEQAKSFIAG